MPANSQVCSAAVRREYRALSSPACITPTYLFVLAVGPDNGVTVPSHIERWDQQEEYDSSMASDRTLQTTSEFSSGQKISERLSSSGTSSGRSSLWRERLLLTEAGASPESSISGGQRRFNIGKNGTTEFREIKDFLTWKHCFLDSVPRKKSPLSSDSGRGADFSGPAVTSYRSPTEVTSPVTIFPVFIQCLSLLFPPVESSCSPQWVRKLQGKEQF